MPNGGSVGATEPKLASSIVSTEKIANGAVTSASAWTVSSDSRLKKDIRPFTDGLQVVRQIQPVWFACNGRAGIPEQTGIGIVAQELALIAPYMVRPYDPIVLEASEEQPGSKENYPGIDYGAMDFILVNALQEQQAQIERLQEEWIR